MAGSPKVNIATNSRTVRLPFLLLSSCFPLSSKVGPASTLEGVWLMALSWNVKKVFLEMLKTHFCTLAREENKKTYHLSY